MLNKEKYIEARIRTRDIKYNGEEIEITAFMNKQQLLDVADVKGNNDFQKGYDKGYNEGFEDGSNEMLLKFEDFLKELKGE